MADIGATLRERRIRDKIDITTVEEATKIRAKYLRALENEEWAVLPGPAYIKSFLRTYAQFLGLDAHMLVEEYRARFEQPEDLELPAFTRDEPPLRMRVRPSGPPSRATLIAALAVALLAVLFVLGVTSNDDNGNGGSAAKRQAASKRKSEPAAGGAPAQARQKAKPSGKLTLAVVPARDVWVCLVDARGRALIGGRTITAAEREQSFESKRFKITVGNGGGDFKVNGKLRDVPDRPTPLGYAISASGTRLLTADERPTCEPGTLGSGTESP